MNKKQQEQAEAEYKTNTSKTFISESCSNFLVAEAYSVCVPATLCSTTSTPRLITLEG